jgi:hypothetical protein
MAVIEELREMARAVQRKKGRMDARERELASHLIASVLADESLDLSEILPSFEVFQSEAIAQAVGEAWPTMARDRRELFSRWLPEPKSEKATRRIAMLAAAVLEVDGVTTLGWLSRLIPQNPKGKLTRETCQVIAGVFFGPKPLRFVRIGDEGNQSEALVGVLKALLQVAVDDHYAVETMARYRLIEDILTIISQRRLRAYDEPKSILARIEIEIKRWPQALIEQLVETLKRRIPDSDQLLKQLSRESVPSTPNQSLHTNLTEQHSEEQIGTAGEKTQIKSTLEQHISSLTSQLQELRALANLLSEEERLKKELERQIQEQKIRESSLQARVEKISAELEDAVTRVKSASIRIEELELANKSTKENMELEQQRLTQQITANALGRVEEFKNNLALVLSRLIRDLPARDTHLTADVGNIVFLQFHQFLDVMDGQGIKIRKGKGAV